MHVNLLRKSNAGSELRSRPGTGIPFPIMRGESPRGLDTELYGETNQKDSWGPVPSGRPVDFGSTPGKSTTPNLWCKSRVTAEVDLGAGNFAGLKTRASDYIYITKKSPEKSEPFFFGFWRMALEKNCRARCYGERNAARSHGTASHRRATRIPARISGILIACRRKTEYAAAMTGVAMKNPRQTRSARWNQGS